MAGRADRRGFGNIRRLKSGRYQARYAGPDGSTVTAPKTYERKEAAEDWLAKERRLTEDPATWLPPAERVQAARAAALAAEAARPPIFEEYAERWLDERRTKGKPLAGRTRDHYEDLLRDYINPRFGELTLDAITPAAVNAWFDELKPIRKRKGHTGETTKAHAYSLGRSIMNTAVSAHGPLVGRTNPFAVRGGGSSPSTKRTELVSAEELAIILETIRPEWRALVLLALWTGLRFSELAELRRSDIDFDKDMLRVRRSVGRSRTQGVHVKDPKSDAGKRDMDLPAAVVPALRSHLRTYVTGRDGLVFPGRGGGHLAPSTFYGKVTCATCKGDPAQCTKRQADATDKHTFEARESGWYAARQTAGHPTLHFHDLRATGATLLAQQGATEAEIQAFLGDSTPQAAQRYVRAARSRMKELTGRLSALAEGGQW